MIVITYAATPYRMQHLRERICNFLEKQGRFPIHPLLAMPYERYNYQRHDRNIICKICFGLVDLSDELMIFGIGGGSLREYSYAKQKGKEVKSLVKIFDQEWERYSSMEIYQKRFGKVLDEVLEKSVVPKKTLDMSEYDVMPLIPPSECF